MNSRELRNAIDDKLTARPSLEGEYEHDILIGLLNQLTQVTEAVLGIAGQLKNTTGVDPLTMREQVILRKFVELPDLPPALTK